MYITDDYICTNDSCSKYYEKVEKFGKRAERDTYQCEICTSLLKRVPTGQRVPHISWSTWRV